jgi:hypothetical protein
MLDGIPQVGRRLVLFMLRSERVWLFWLLILMHIGSRLQVSRRRAIGALNSALCYP